MLVPSIALLSRAREAPPPAVSVGGVALGLGLAFFLGLAFEEVHARSEPNRPGGIRTFPILALAGTALFALEPRSGLLLLGGLFVLGAWLTAYYVARLRSAAGEQGAGAELVVPLCNVLALLIGPIALTQPAWLAVGLTVAAVLLLGARDALHALAARLPGREITTLGKFLVLIGIVLPLLPNEPVTPLTSITPRQVWLAVVVVCSLSYGSYLVQRFVSPGRGLLAAAVLGGLYSSTATTVVLARRAKEGSITKRDLCSATLLATALLYPRVGVVIALFAPALALRLAPALAALCTFALLLAAAAHRFVGGEETSGAVAIEPRNPLELGAALLFALLFVVVSIASKWIEARYGDLGLYGLAALVGVTDIDPFVLSVAQGGASAASASALAAAILVAASSNNLLKAAYAAGFAGPRASRAAVLGLVALAAAGLGAAALA